MTLRRIIDWLRRLLASPEGKRQQGITLLLSFLLAFSLWFIVTLNQSYSTSLRVPVKVSQIPETILPERDPRFQVTLDVTGSGLDLLLEHFRLQRDTVVLPFRDEWQQDEPVALDSYRSQFLSVLPSKVSIQAFSPRSLSFPYANKTHHRVPLELITRFRLQPGYQLEQPPSLLTDSVTILGPRNIIDTITRWYTRPEARDLTGLESQIQIPVVDSIEKVTVTPKTVIVEVQPRKYTELVLRRPLRVTGLPPNAEASLSTSYLQMVCVVPMDVFESFQSQLHGDTLNIPYSELSPHHTYWTPNYQQLPPGVKVIRNDPSRIQVLISRSTTALARIKP